MLYMYRDVKKQKQMWWKIASPPSACEIGCGERSHWERAPFWTVQPCVRACVRVLFPLGLCARELTFSLSPLPIRPDAWVCACRFFLISFFLIVAFSSRSPATPTLKQNVGVYSFAQFKTWVPFPSSPACQIRAQGCMICREKIDEKCSIFCN